MKTAVWLAAGVVGSGLAARASDLEFAPINYSKAPADNVVSRLQQRIDEGKVRLTRDDKFGFLKAVMRELGLSESSQTLVFSKTSFQLGRISPTTPRALYFNDDVYIGYCDGGDVMEFAAPDPQLGTVFYSLSQEKSDKPKFVRQTDSCLICHGSSRNQGLPGHVLRSVYPDTEGYAVLSSGTHRIDHTSPIADRWGGWYVTGTHGNTKHLGNMVVSGRRARPEEIDNEDGRNVTDLGGRFRRKDYLTADSDIVALMALEHQAEMHNLIARATLNTRMALHEEAALNRELKLPPDNRWESIGRRIAAVGEPLVKYMLFAGEAKIEAPIKGTTRFAEEFAAKGPRDKKGRSLREFDLRRRMMKYPCSWLIYSPVFDAMPAPVKDYVMRRLREVLTGKDKSADFAHLSDADRQAVLEILTDTKPGFAAAK